MNYIVFTKDLRMNLWKNRLRFKQGVPEKKSFLADVPDNYDRHPDFGFRVDDDTRAIEHAYQTIRKLREKTLDSSKRENLRKQFCLDVKNYIMCMDTLFINNYGKVRILLNIMAELNCEEDIIEIIGDYYKRFVDSVEGYEEDLKHQKWVRSRTFIPNYVDLYIKMGDRALFLKEDMHLAMRCYALADLDWYGFRDEERVDNPWKQEVSEEEYQRLAEWHEYFGCLQRFVSGEAESDDIWKDQTLNVEMRDAFGDFLAFYENEFLYKELWESATRYFQALEQKIEDGNPTVEELRSGVVIAHLVRDRSILAGLLHLKDENDDLKKQIQIYVLECISNTTDRNLQPVKAYIQGKNFSEQLLKDVLLFANGIYMIQNIRIYLLVDNVPTNMAYYTALDTFFYMLPARMNPGEKCGRLSIMNIAYMNDPNEGKMLKKFLFGEADLSGGEERQSVKYPYVFMKCFTSRIDDLPMWEMYGNHAKGCCLVLDWKKMRAQMGGKKDVPLYRVCYLSKGPKGYQAYREHNGEIADLTYFNKCLKQLARIAEELRLYPDTLECFMSLLEDILYLFKDGSYSYEEELRIYYNYPVASDAFRHSGGEYPKLFVQPEFDIHLKEIIIGPKFEGLADKMPYIQEQVEMMCRETKAKVPRITMSGIEYR